jgi:adenylate cyclase class 2
MNTLVKTNNIPAKMSDQEIEAKFLNIDKSQVIDRLTKLGAIQQFEILYRRQVFDYPDRRLDKNAAWIRLRDEGYQTTLTYKRRLGVKDRNRGQDDEGMEELEVIVSDFDTTAAILLKTGLELNHYAENKRTRYLLDDVEVDIDEWPLLEPYIEIEAASWPEVDETAQKIGLNPQDKIICSTNQIYDRLGIRFNDYRYVTFDRQIKHS